MSCDVEVDERRVDAFLTKSRHYVICEHMQCQGLKALQETDQTPTLTTTFG